MLKDSCIPVSWYAIFAPAGTLNDVVAQSSAVAKHELRTE